MTRAGLPAIARQDGTPRTAYLASQLSRDPRRDAYVGPGMVGLWLGEPVIDVVTDAGDLEGLGPEDRLSSGLNILMATVLAPLPEDEETEAAQHHGPRVRFRNEDDVDVVDTAGVNKNQVGILIP
jgi:hypothetical protein